MVLASQSQEWQVHQKHKLAMAQHAMWTKNAKSATAI
jgi:hypothetical protein